ncbi:MAG: EAL domain-containing protein [Rhodospirillales bacterium]|nr:EAL domain-containing protein [Rhodospirillales bacterium]
MTQRSGAEQAGCNEYDTELLSRIEELIRGFQAQVSDAHGTAREGSMVYGLRVLVALANMVLHKQDVFGIEPWHAIAENAPLSMPGEMLLRVKDFKGNPLAPYDAVMAFYENGYTAQIDGILFLAALGQFDRMRTAGREKQVTINISARSLRNPDFVKATLTRLESLDLASDEKVLVEIHESAPHLSLSRQVLELYKILGVGFVIDDVGMNMNDVLRLADFEGLAEYVKLDRQTVCAPKGKAYALDQVMSFVETLMPGSVCVAEGVQSAEHALEIAQKYPSILYAQGLYLTHDRAAFQDEFSQARARQAVNTRQAQA